MLSLTTFVLIKINDFETLNSYEFLYVCIIYVLKIIYVNERSQSMWQKHSMSLNDNG